MRRTNISCIRTILLAAAALFFIAAAAFVIDKIRPTSDVIHAKVDIGQSDVFTEQDRAEAAELVLEKVRDDFEYCKLLKLSYSGDSHSNNSEDLEWLNGMTSRGGGNFTQCIRFDSSERWTEDTGFCLKGETDSFDFWLAREDGGEWKIMTWGY